MVLANKAIDNLVVESTAFRCARIAIESVLTSLTEATALELVRFVLRPATWDAFAAAFPSAPVEQPASE